MSTTLLEPFLVRRHPLHQNEVLVLKDRSPSSPSASSSSFAAAAEVSKAETSVLCAVRRMSEAHPAGSRKGEERVGVVDGGTLKEEKGGAGRGGSQCKEKTTGTGGSEQRSFREKILAFEEFSSQNTGQKGCSRRWARPFSSSSSSSASKTIGNLPSTETTKDTDKKRGTKDADNGRKDCALEAEQSTQQQQQQQVEDGNNDDMKTSKPHWTVRLSQRLMKIRGKLEQRCHSEQRTQTTTKRSKQGIGSSVATHGSSLSNVFQMESSFTDDSSPSNQDRGLLISRSCSELNEAEGSESMCTEGDSSTLQDEKRNASVSHGKPDTGVRFAMAKHQTPSSSSTAAAAVEKVATGDEVAEDGKSKQNGTKSSFISELRRFYDRSCSDKKSVQRRFFKGTSKKNKQPTGGCEDTSDGGTYIEADRIDRDILISNPSGPITSSIDSTADETKNETVLMRDVCDVQVTQPCNLDDSTDSIATPASEDMNERRSLTVVIGDNSERTTVVTEENNCGTVATDSNGKSERSIRAAREVEVIVETGAPEVPKTDIAVEALNGRRCLHPDREMEGVAKNKKQVTPVPWRKPLSPPPPLAVFSSSTRDPPPPEQLHCKAIVEEWRLPEPADNRMIGTTGNEICDDNAKLLTGPETL